MDCAVLSYADAMVGVVVVIAVTLALIFAVVKRQTENILGDVRDVRLEALPCLETTMGGPDFSISTASASVDWGEVWLRRRGIKVVYDGFSQDLDDRIMAALEADGFEWYASGFDFEESERDLAFDLPEELQAWGVEQRIGKSTDGTRDVEK